MGEMTLAFSSMYYALLSSLMAVRKSRLTNRTSTGIAFVLMISDVLSDTFLLFLSSKLSRINYFILFCTARLTTTSFSVDTIDINRNSCITLLNGVVANFTNCDNTHRRWLMKYYMLQL